MKPKISNLEDHVGFWLRRLSNHVSEAFAARLERLEVSAPQWIVLRILFDEDTLALRQIAKRIGVDRGAMSRMVERLVIRGLLSRTDSPTNRREVAIALTKKGRKLVPKLAREADRNDRAFFGQLPEPRRTEFLATIKQLLSPNGSMSIVDIA